MKELGAHGFSDIFSDEDCESDLDLVVIPQDFGWHSCKMFLKGKSVRFGYKVWCLCSSGGYLYNFDLYSGKLEDKLTILG